MAGRTEYNKCMVPYMKGSGEDKKLGFCVGAKICSGKATSEDQARQICLTEPKKQPKPRKSKKSCGTDMEELAACAVGKLTPEVLSSSRGLDRILTEILQECSCGKVTKTKSTKRKRSTEELSDEEIETLATINELSGVFSQE